MHICRIRYTVLGLLIYYLQSAFSWSCVSEFEDVASKTVMADIVFEGQAHREIKIKEKPGFYNFRFTKINLIKGNPVGMEDQYSRTSKNVNNNDIKLRNDKRHYQGLHNHLQPPPFHSVSLVSDPRPKSRKRSRAAAAKSSSLNSLSIDVGEFGPETDQSECVYSKNVIARGQRYLVFLFHPSNNMSSHHFFEGPNDKTSKSSKDRARHRSTTSRPPLASSAEIVYRMSGSPVASSGSARREATGHNCSDCGKKPRITKITPSLNVTEGRRIKLVCRSTGFPKPQVIWLKNGLLLESEGNVSIKARKQNSILLIKNAKDEDTGQYQCSGFNVLGYSHLNSTFVAVLSRAKKPFSEQCQNQNYCVNGMCLKLTTKENYFCICTGDFIGQRCEEKNTGYVAIMRKKRKRSFPLHPLSRYYPKMLRI